MAEFIGVEIRILPDPEIPGEVRVEITLNQHGRMLVIKNVDKGNYEHINFSFIGAPDSYFDEIAPIDYPYAPDSEG